MRGRRIPIPLPNTGGLSRRRSTCCMRTTLIVIVVILFVILQINIVNYTDFNESINDVVGNDSSAAILSMVPPVFHKYLTVKPRNGTQHGGSNGTSHTFDSYRSPNISDMLRYIKRYNDMQTVLNEDVFGPLQNDSVIIVVQIHTRIKYLRHLIVSLAQARDISKTLLIFSHDYYDEDINDLVQTIDFCKVMQIFYPYSIQTHPNEFPGADPDDCPRDIKREQAILRKCNNALFPDLYGHYREAAFTQTKHHWWWKANRVFDQLEATRYHTGLVLFLEEDHYVAEDFLHVLEIMQRRGIQLCPKCNILSLGTYLKTFNYYTFNNNNNKNKKALFGQTHYASASNMLFGPGDHTNHNNFNVAINHQSSDSTMLLGKNADVTYNYVNPNGHHKVALVEQRNVANIDKLTGAAQTWGYQVLPSLYSIYQKVEVTPWISSKHNMGFAFNRTTWREISSCASFFCSYDDYNWDWSLQHVSQKCLKHKLHALVVKGPRVFHIGECGVHHRKQNCESNQVISKVQQVIRIATKSGQLYPKSITLTMASVQKKNVLRKGNGGWGDKRDHVLCMNML